MNIISTLAHLPVDAFLLLLTLGSWLGFLVVAVAIVAAATAGFSFMSAYIAILLCSRSNWDRNEGIGSWIGGVFGLACSIAALCELSLGQAFLSLLGLFALWIAVAAGLSWYYESRPRRQPANP